MLKLRLSPAAEKAVRRGHPWVYADRIRERNRAGESGELAIIYDRNDTFLAIGLYDSDSPIAVRVFHTGKPKNIDDVWWNQRFRQSLDVRASLFADESTTGFRCINGESDGWPGLVLDRYDTTLVLKVYTNAWLRHLDRIVGLVVEQLQPNSLVLRLSRNIRVAADEHSLCDGDVVYGEDPGHEVIFRESGLLFEADVLRGQKTGFFLDQRENRQRVREFAKGADMLNAFSHAGGFSVYAAAGGARSTIDLDISGHALDAAKRNVQLNTGNENVAACNHETVKADAFKWLADQHDARFDIIVIDPPSLAKRESEKTGATASYHSLAREGLRLLRPQGILVAASCSAHVTADAFFQTVRRATVNSGRRFEELQTTRHALDHPAIIPEANYLKCIYLRVR